MRIERRSLEQAEEEEAFRGSKGGSVFLNCRSR